MHVHTVIDLDCGVAGAVGATRCGLLDRANTVHLVIVYGEP